MKKIYSSVLLAVTLGTPTDIATAITNWQTNGGTLTLSEDCEYDATQTVTISKEATLNLNGKTLTWNANFGSLDKNKAVISALVVDAETLTIKASPADNATQKGTLVLNVNHDQYTNLCAILVGSAEGSNAKLEATDGVNIVGNFVTAPTYTYSGTTPSKQAYLTSSIIYPFYGAMDIENANIQMQGECGMALNIASTSGDIVCTNNTIAYMAGTSTQCLNNCFGISANKAGIVLDNNKVDLSAVTGAYISGGKTITALNIYALKVAAANITVKGSESLYKVDVTGAKSYSVNGATNNVWSVEDGTFVGKWQAGRSISGGKFTHKPDAKYVAADSYFEKEGEYYVIKHGKSYVVRIGGVDYLDTDDWASVCSRSADSYTSVTIIGHKDFTIPEGVYVYLYFKTADDAKAYADMTITNNGNVRLGGSWKKGSLVNNGTLEMLEYCDLAGTSSIPMSIVNNATGKLFINKGAKQTSSVKFGNYFTLTNNGGQVSVSYGRFTEKAFAEIYKKGEYDYIADGYVHSNKQADGYYHILAADAVCAKVGDVGYEDLAAAIKASSVATPAYLQKDYTLGKKLSLVLGSPEDGKVLNLNGKTLTLDNVAADVKQEMVPLNNINLTIQNGTIVGGGDLLFSLTGKSTSDGANYTTLTIEKDVTIRQTDGWYVIAAINPKEPYGIVVNFDGKIEQAQAAFYVNGTLQQCTQNYPIFNINKDATITTTAAAIYAAGYAEWNIRGTVNCHTGVAIKAGKLNVYEGATIAANGDAKRVVGMSNGIDESGAAIQIESMNGYSACGIDVNINGGNISSKNGYAIYEYLSEKGNTTNTHVKDIAVGGNVKVDGPISISQDMASTVGGFINGGTYTSDINAYVKDGFITKTNGDGTYGVTAEEATVINNVAWASQTTGAVNAKVQGAVETSNDVAAKRVLVEAGATLTVKAGTTLTIGVGGLHLQNAATSKVVVEAGATLLVDGLVFNATADNLLIKSSEAQPGRLLISPTTEMYGEDHPSATIEFVSKSYLNGSKQVWQRFGIPSNTAIKEMTCSDASIQTFIYEPDYTGMQWNMLGKLGNFDVTLMNRPFACYDMACNAKQAGTVYTIKSELMGNSNIELPAVANWNYFANSYTGDINIVAMLEEFNNNGGTIDPTVYVAREDKGIYVWDFVNLLDDNGVTSIAPMQAYIVRNTSAATTTPLKYNEMVWTPATTAQQNKVAARQNAVSDMTKVRIRVSNAAGSYDNVVVGESAQFSADYDKGYDAVKYINEDINIYVMADEKQSTFATDDLNNTYLGFSCVNGGTYTISFSSVKGEELYLTDLFTNKKVQMAVGVTYEFDAAANTTNDRRFVISKRQGVVTGIDNVVAPQATGIYDLMGQYIGEMSEWNNLPSGIYIVNGQKQVK